jgi:hypothetical protein
VRRGVEESERVELPQPNFRGVLLKNPYFKSRKTLDYPPKRHTSYALTIPLTLLLLLAMLLFNVFTLAFANRIRNAVDNFVWRTTALAVVSAGGMFLFNAAYDAAARWMTRFENYRTLSEESKVQTIRFASYQVISNYISLFWVAFASCEGGACPTALTLLRFGGGGVR